MGKDFKDRLDLRVDPDLKIRFREYCDKNNITLSDAIRDALTTYEIYREFIGATIEDIQNPDFYNKFKRFLESLSPSMSKPLEMLLGPEEERLIKETSPRLLKNIRVVTQMGKKALKDISV